MAQNEEMKKIFVPSSGGENKGKIDSVIAELRSVSIDHTNFHKYFDMVNTAITILRTNIDSALANYIQIKEEFDEMKETSRIQDGWERGIVPRDFFLLLQRTSACLHEIVSWKYIEAQLSSLLMQKAAPAMTSMKSLEIEKDTLAEFRKMQEERDKLVTQMFQRMGDNFKQSMELMMRTHRTDARENLQIIIGALQEVSGNYKDVMVKIGEKPKPQAFEDPFANTLIKKKAIESYQPEIVEREIKKKLPPPTPPPDKKMTEEELFSDKSNDKLGEVKKDDNTVSLSDL
jgi:hypothetical protein